MKLFLTSAGISNKTISNAFLKLVGLPKSKIKIAFIPTAANVETGDKAWLVDDLFNVSNLKTGQLDIVDISALPEKIWLSRIKEANVLFLGGGNTYHLMHWVRKSGLEKLLPELLKTRVYAGISAGSCITGPTVYNSVQNLFGEKYDLEVKKGLGLTKFHFIPHLNSKYFTKIRTANLKKAAQDLKEPVYALDDSSAMVIDGEKMQIVTEGKWVKFAHTSG